MTRTRSNRREFLGGLIGGALAGVAAPAVHAQTYPDRPIRIIVPFAPGGLNDVVARLIGPHLERSLGQPVVIDNRPGASGIVGTNATAKAPPDGYTLVMVASSYTILPATHAKLPYDPERDLTPVGMVAKNSLLFVVNAKTAARSLGELVALAKANPGKLNYASPGAATQTHLVVELFSRLAGIRLQHIPYRGGAPAIQAMLADDTQFTVISTLLSLPQIEAGALFAIATGGRSREAQLPQVPTVAEQGFPGFEAVQWVSLMTAAGTPADIVARLNGALNHALKDPDLVAKLAAQGQSPAGGTPEEFSRLIATEIRNWTEVARAANIRAE
jgi:tripartite-type tricarboxylate transporter receptor subunit TctC